MGEVHHVLGHGSRPLVRQRPTIEGRQHDSRGRLEYIHVPIIGILQDTKSQESRLSLMEKLVGVECAAAKLFVGGAPHPPPPIKAQ